MDNKTLLEEQQHVNSAQELIDNEVNELDSHIHNLASQNYDAMKYVLSENLDTVELAEAYGEINTKDEFLYDLTSKRLFLKRIRPKPFFARLIFDKEGKKKTVSSACGAGNIGQLPIKQGNQNRPSHQLLLLLNCFSCVHLCVTS